MYPAHIFLLLVYYLSVPCHASFVFFEPHLCNRTKKVCTVWPKAESVSVPVNVPTAFMQRDVPGNPIDDSGWRVRIVPCDITCDSNVNLYVCQDPPESYFSTCTPTIYTFPMGNIEFSNLQIESAVSSVAVRHVASTEMIQATLPDPYMCAFYRITVYGVQMYNMKFDLSTCAAVLNQQQLKAYGSSIYHVTTPIIVQTLDAHNTYFSHICTAASECAGVSSIVRFVPPPVETVTGCLPEFHAQHLINIDNTTIGVSIVDQEASSLFDTSVAVTVANYYGTMILVANATVFSIGNSDGFIVKDMYSTGTIVNMSSVFLIGNAIQGTDGAGVCADENSLEKRVREETTAIIAMGVVLGVILIVGVVVISIKLYKKCKHNMHHTMQGTLDGSEETTYESDDEQSEHETSSKKTN